MLRRAQRFGKVRRGRAERTLTRMTHAAPTAAPRESGDGHSTCIFCRIASGAVAASIVFEDELTMAFLDLRQFHPGHVLVIPRRHVSDIRSVDEDTAAAVMRIVVRIARAVDHAFPSDGLSVWHSAGEGANQEVPHLHVHVHPRHVGDDVLAVYPAPPDHPPRETLDDWAERLRNAL